MLAVLVIPTNQQDRAQVGELDQQIRDAIGASAEVGFVDQDYSSDGPVADTQAHGIRLEVVKLPASKRGFVLLPRCWVIERSLAWMGRFGRLARDYKRWSGCIS